VIEKTSLFPAAVLALLAFPCPAQEHDVTALSQFNASFSLSEKTRLTLHTRLRFNHDMGDFYQFRGGPIVFYDWKSRLQWQAGWYFIEQEGVRGAIPIQRPWGGAQMRVYGNGRFSVDWRNLLERHMYAGPEDFTRFRTRISVNFQPKVGWQPFANVEALALKGHVIGRYGAGMGYTTEGGHLFGVGYEYRPDVLRPGSHVITTMVQFRVAGLRRRHKAGESEVPH
jgi:hypothetical protein